MALLQQIIQYLLNIITDICYLMRRSPRKKQPLITPLIKKTESIQHIPQPSQEKQQVKESNSKSEVKKKISINTENFVLLKDGKFEDHYRIIDKIGEGSFGSVYKVEHKNLKIHRALKMIKKKRTEAFSTFEEIQVLKKLDHSNILKIFEFYEADESYYLITQIFEGRELFDQIVDLDKFDQCLASKIIHEVLRALHYTHSHGIAHRDVKPENIMVRKLGEKNMKIKIIDWGLGTLIGPELQTNRICGTPQYCAPQVLKGKYSVSCDMWSVGVIAYMMQTGQMLFRGKNTQETMSIVSKAMFKPKAKIYNKLSNDSKNFMKALLIKDPKKRMTAEKALQHPWITRYNSEKRQEPQFLKETLQRLRDFKLTNRLGVAVVSYVNNHLTSNEEKQRLQDIFQFLDKNGDGVLSSDQLIEGYSKIYGKAVGTKIAQDTFAKLDINSNGTLDYSEFVAFGLKREHDLQKIRLKQAFNLFDRNGDGKISSKQISQVLQGKIEDLSENQFADIIRQFDKDQDNEINFDEFQKCVDQIYMKVSKKREEQSMKRSKDVSDSMLRSSLIRNSMMKSSMVRSSMRESIIKKPE